MHSACPPRDALFICLMHSVRELLFIIAILKYLPTTPRTSLIASFLVVFPFEFSITFAKKCIPSCSLSQAIILTELHEEKLLDIPPPPFLHDTHHPNNLITFLLVILEQVHFTYPSTFSILQYTFSLMDAIPLFYPSPSCQTSSPHHPTSLTFPTMIGKRQITKFVNIGIWRQVGLSF
ncbi:hypothetical protein KSP39_PZI011286 [Platanthera zijinensis]|uniref:Uncharacterized protein n=1 Tax=Platanthera zijinensis TaxID=2320716 RepID=A0AAP0BGM5_9ASPA